MTFLQLLLACRDKQSRDHLGLSSFFFNGGQWPRRRFSTTTMATRHRTFYHLAATILIAFLLTALTSAQPPWQICGKSGNYAANDTYQSNIRQLSTTLPKNASSSRTLFATGTFGTLPDIVYALALCRGDGNASACEACVTTAFQDAQQLCAFNKDATVIYDPCYLRFSNQNFLATTSNDNFIVLENTQSVSSPVDVFDAAVQTLLNATRDYAAANSSRRFATGEESFDTSNPTIYGLVQCTPDMSPADCRSCLGDIITKMPRDLSGSIGGRMIGVRCNFRYEVVPFFSGSPTLRLPAPPAPPVPPPAPVNVTPTATPGGELQTQNFLNAVSSNTPCMAYSV